MNSKINFACYCDNNYLVQFLVLHDSIKKYIPDFHIYLLCLDDIIYNNLKMLKLDNVKLYHIDTLNVKDATAFETTRAYIWSLTPFLCLHILNNESVKNIAFVDVDTEFLSVPSSELYAFMSSEHSVLITEHGYEPDFDVSFFSGKYCVQLVIFKNTEPSVKILRRWARDCENLLHDRHEAGVFGDQYFLNDWPVDYGNNIYIYKQKEHFQGPWNTMRFPYSEAFFFHYQGMKILSDKKFYFGTKKLNKIHKKYVYQPYVNRLSKKIKYLNKRQLVIGYHSIPHFIHRFRSRVWNLFFSLGIR